MKKFLISFLVLTLLMGCSKPAADSEKANAVEMNSEEMIA